MKKPLKRRKAQAHTFYFKYDKDDPDLLHIYARHLMTEQDAIDTFFQGIATWNEAFERFESCTATHGLYWFWLDMKKKKVMVISCFKV